MSENILWLSVIVIIYMAVVGYLAYLGYRRTTSASDYLIAGRGMHPFVMALSYGATFISTSAIVGFGGAAGVFGMGILWLTFLNISVGIFIAFVFFGGRTRKMGHHLDAHTFPEFLAKRFDSKFIQVFTGLVIFCCMPLYAGVILKGAGDFIKEYLHIQYDVALFFFAVIVFMYVMMGGLKGVMYTDAFQGSVMLVGMIVLLSYTYTRFGGIVPAHEALTAATDQAVAVLGPKGHQGWTSMPKAFSGLWWTLVSTIVMGVGIGVLAQPQLVVRFMTVKSQRELNRAVLVGGVFILFMTGVAFVVGSLSNLYFLETTGKIAIVAAKGNVGDIIPKYITGAMPGWFGAVFMVTLLAAAMSTASSQFHAMGAAMGRDVLEQAGRNAEHSMLINRIGLSAAFIVSLFIAWGLPKLFPGQGVAIIARGTALFFGLCAATFLPAYIGALYWRRLTRPAVIASMLVGFFSSAFWLFFVHEKESSVLLLCKAIFGKPSLAMKQVGEDFVPIVTGGKIIWMVVDPLFVALPLSALTLIVVTYLTKPYSEEFLKKVGL